MNPFKLIYSLLVLAISFVSALCEENPHQLRLATDYGDFTGGCGINRIPGTKTIAYAVPTGEITTWPALKTTTAPGDSITLDGDIILDAVTVGKGYFRQMDIVTDTGEISSAWVGDVGGKAWENRFSFFLAGTSTQNIEWYDCLVNNCNVMLVATRESPSEYKVLGSKDDPIIFEEVNITTGLAVGDRSGAALVAYDPAGHPIYTYAGTVDTTPNS